MGESDVILEARGLVKAFGRGRTKVDVLRGLDLRIRRGEFTAVMGPSGCGKSTLLHCLGLMTPPDDGQVLLDGRAAGTSPAGRNRLRRTEIGFVFQRFNLIPVLSGRDNVVISLKVRGVGANGRADALFETMGVSDAAARKPGQMSIGEQQRVAVVRALAHEPKIVLADEPTGNLDSDSAAALLSLFQRIHRDHGQTIVMITHSAEAASYAQRVRRMKDGRIVDQP